MWPECEMNGRRAHLKFHGEHERIVDFHLFGCVLFHFRNNVEPRVNPRSNLGRAAPVLGYTQTLLQHPPEHINYQCRTHNSILAAARFNHCTKCRKVPRSVQYIHLKKHND